MGTQLVEQNELKETLELKERIENNTVVELWENSEDYERLANATRKTMRYINDEQIKSFADALNQTNEKILNLTFEGVKKHHEKKFEQIRKKQKIYVASAFAAGVFVGAKSARIYGKISFCLVKIGDTNINLNGKFYSDGALEPKI